MTDKDPGNFEFLGEYDPRLQRLAQQAESYVHTDPDSCLFKLRLMVETMAKRLIELERPDLVSADLGSMLKGLEQSRLLSRRQADSLHAIRRDGNAAVHGEISAPPTAMRRLSAIHRLCAWYVSMIRRGAAPRLGKFVPPSPPVPVDERRRALLEKVELLEREIDERRERTRSSLLLFDDAEEADREAARLRGELEGLDRVAAAAGEPLIDAESVVLIMAMELESLLEHPRLGFSSRHAQREANRQLDHVRRQLADRERAYAEERTRLAAQQFVEESPADDVD